MSAFDLTFLQPKAAWLLSLLPLAWWVARPVRRPGVLALRLALFACLVAALMQPSFLFRSRAGRAAIVLDQRDALGASGREQARRAVRNLLKREPAGTQVTLVQIGGGVDIGKDGGWSKIGRRIVLPDGTPSTGMARALGALPLGSAGRITLVTDGRSSDGEWRRVAATISHRGIPVDTVAVAGAAPSLAITGVRVARARVGEQVAVRVEMNGDGATHRLNLTSNGRPLGRSVQVGGTGPQAATLLFPATAPGFLPLRVTLSSDGAAPVRPYNTVAAIDDPMRLLYVGGREAGGAGPLRALLGSGVAIDSATPAQAGSDPDLSRYPLLLLDDVAAARWPTNGQARLLAATRDHGTGLMVAGGRAAFGPGGYTPGMPLADALPVTARQEEKVEQPSIALAVVIDTSGSMEGAPLALAKQIARQTVRKLTPRDRIGVVEFYGAQQWAVPMQPATDIPGAERAIGRMRADGATVLFPALQEAYFALLDADTRFRHLVVITDGGVSSDRYGQLLQQAARNRINVSVVGVGGDAAADAVMARWARWGGGRFYAVADEYDLVALDFRQPEIKQEPGYRDGATAIRTAGTSMWWPDRRLTLPPIAGYARTRVRPAADTLASTATGDPLLATWQYGSGRVTAFMTEPFGQGTAAWRGWPGYGAWLSRVVAMTARQRPAFALDLVRTADMVEARAQRFDTTRGGVPQMRLIGADGGARPLTGIEQRAPGLFVASIPASAATAVMVEVTDNAGTARAASPAFADASPPGTESAAEAIPLADLSAATGGVAIDGAGSAATRAPVTTGGEWAAADLWPWLALVGLVLYLAELAYRRWPSRRPIPSNSPVH